MRRLLSLMVLFVLLATAASAHNGMLALYTDMGAVDCDAAGPKATIIPLYLMYVRGDGPDIASCAEFRLLKSSTDILFLEPQWAGTSFIQFGSLQEGVSICAYSDGGVMCTGTASTLYLGNLSVVNVADPDTFYVSVVEDPLTANQDGGAGIYVLECLPGYPMYKCIGGTFIFNGRCCSAENPFAENIAVEVMSWGAIKNLYKNE